MTAGAILAVMAETFPPGGSVNSSCRCFLPPSCSAAVLPLHFGGLAAAVPVTFAATLWIMCKTTGRPDAEFRLRGEVRTGDGEHPEYSSVVAFQVKM